VVRLLQFSVNISTVFTELPLLQRAAAAAAQGFQAVEVQFPYLESSKDFAASINDAGVKCVLLNLPAGDLTAGDLGLACLADRQQDFDQSLVLALEYAKAVDCPQINCLSGNVRGDRSSCWNTLLKNVNKAAQFFERHGIKLLVEVLNPIDSPDFILTASSHADALFKEVNHPNLGLQYDVYHRRAAGEDWLAGLLERIKLIEHIQFSDYPGRHEPGTGDIDMRALFRQLEMLPYKGWLGAEYKPLKSSDESFGWKGWN